MKKIIFTLLISFILSNIKGQLIDNYGLKTGPGLSNLCWKYHRDEFSDLSGWKDNKTGFLGQVYAEKSLYKYLSLHAAFGYIQKGYKNDITYTTEVGEELEIKKPNALLHQLSLDISLKINLMQKNIIPYILMGLREDYLLAYRGVIVNVQGEDLELDIELFDDFKKFNSGGIIGAGITFKNFIFFEMEYNPTLTKYFTSDLLSVKGHYFGLTAGVNLYQMIKNKN